MPQSPHDHLFKAVFSRPAEAASFLSAHLPPGLAAAIRWDELVCVKASFESHDGASSEADLVFAARLDVGDGAPPTEVEIAILFEHQSTPDDTMPLRLLGYMLRTFEAQLADRERKRPVPVIPIVLYHGDRPWTAPTRFSAWMRLSDKALALVERFLPDYEYVLEERRPPRPECDSIAIDAWLSLHERALLGCRRVVGSLIRGLRRIHHHVFRLNGVVNQRHRAKSASGRTNCGTDKREADFMHRLFTVAVSNRDRDFGGANGKSAVRRSGEHCSRGRVDGP
jgi:hypothetical protein